MTLLARAAVGLFESCDETKNYAKRVDAQIESMQSDVIRWATAKYGPDAFAASCATPELCAQQKADRERFSGWFRFREAWKTEKSDIDDTEYFCGAALYARVQKYDVDSQAWRVVLEKEGIRLSSAPLSQPGIIPGITTPVNPLVKDEATISASLGNFAGALLKLGLVVGGGYLAYKLATSRASAPLDARPAEAGR